jgi:hypothetical protein
MSTRPRHRRRRPVPGIGKASAFPLEKALTTTGAVAAGLAVLAGAPSADAATFTVTNTNDGGAGSLRDAIVSANNNVGPDVITFNAAVTGTITLTGGQLYISDDVDVQGPGAAVLTVSGNNASRVFYIYNSDALIDVTLSGLTIAQGTAAFGGGVINFDENVTLDHDVITANTATVGGGVATGGTTGTLTVTNTTISGNTASAGGGIYLYDNGAPALIQDSIISGNQATSGSGGGLFFYGPNYDVTIRRTTISGNIAAGRGGGIYFYDTDGGAVLIEDSTVSGNQAGIGGGMYFYNVDDPVTISNSTISGNSATYGGGIVFYGSGVAPFTISNSTISGNTATMVGGNLASYGKPVTLNNSIVADGVAPASPDLYGGTFTANFSLIETPGGAALVTGTGTVTGVDPQLGPLQNNGGPTFTQLPAPTSPVINAGDPAFAPPPANDQRGLPRVAGGRIDMGAVEVQAGVFQLSSATYSVAENGASVLITVNRTGGTDPATVNYATSNGSATAGADYTSTSGTLSFAAGQTTATFNVPILDDNLVEGNETFNVTLSAPSAGGSLGATSAAVVTINDVEEGHLQFSSATGTVSEKGGSIAITVTRVGGSDGAVSATYGTSNGSATAGSDYTATAGTVMFANGDAAPKTFNVPILDDALTEGSETFNVNLTAPTGGATLGAPATEVVTITDFEEGTLQFSAAAMNVNESAGVAVLTVTRTGGSDGLVDVTYVTTLGTAAPVLDFTPDAGTLSWGPGNTTPHTIVIGIANDGVPEGPETFNVQLSNPVGGATLGTPSTEVVTILDAAPPPGTVQFSTPVYTVVESAGTVALTITRTGGSSGPLTVTYTTNNGTATAPSDFPATTNTVTFADGDTTPKTINIPIVSDAVPEPAESFTVSLSMPTAGALGAQSVTTVTITPPLEEIPVLGPIGKLLLALSTMASALWIMGRRRFFGFLFAAAMIGVMTANLSAATTKPSQPVVHAKNGWHGSMKLGKSKVTGVLSEVQAGEKSTTLKLTNGMSIAVTNAQAAVSLHGGTASINALAPGQKVTIVTMTDPKGNVMRVKIKVKN